MRSWLVATLLAVAGFRTASAARAQMPVVAHVLEDRPFGACNTVAMATR